MKYSIVRNKYEDSKKIEFELKTILKANKKFILDDSNPECVFIIGGDGTFLSAISKFNEKLRDIIFIPIKFGGIGFYTNHNSVMDIKENIECLMNSESFSTIEYGLLTVQSNFVKNAINEIKIVNDSKPIEIDIYVNDEILETFKGTGVVFSTATGSTGFMKSSGGAIIYPNCGLFQMQEIFPVSTNKFRTLNSPIIFNNDQEIKLIIKNKTTKIFIDTIEEKISSSEMKIRLSDFKIKVLKSKQTNTSKTKILNDLFVLNNPIKD